MPLERLRGERAELRSEALGICRRVVASAGEMRVDQLVYAAAEAYPQLLPRRESVERELGKQHREKEGVELAQGIFLAELLAVEDPGRRLIEVMRRPKDDSSKHLETFQREDRLDLGSVRLERRGDVGFLYFSNIAFLNAEDDALLEAFEFAVDVLLLDSRVRLCVLRGSIVDHPKYRGRRVFCSGINLTHLYEGEISYLYFMVRELGPMNKIFRGLSLEQGKGGVEKPWIAVVESHAIGGGCQMLLVADYVIAEENAFFSVPARNEGFIPGAANLRLSRFVGPRVARQMIYLNRKLGAAEALATGLVDEVVPLANVDEALERAVRNFTEAGVMGFAANRGALHLAEEPTELFRAYMAELALKQAQALFSEELISNLERHWTSRGRTTRE